MSLFNLNAHEMICSKGDFTTLYKIEQVNGQLIVTFKNVCAPSRGCEVFMKRLPRDILLQEILEFSARSGNIYRIRLLMDFSGYNRGYCFVTYFDTVSARKATMTLNGENIREGHNVIVKMSFDNNKLEMRGVPRHLNHDDIWRKMSAIGDGLKAIIALKTKDESEPSFSGTCILKYFTHKHALEARKRLWPRVKIWGKYVDVDWAVPREIMNVVQSDRWFLNSGKYAAKNADGYTTLPILFE